MGYLLSFISLISAQSNALDLDAVWQKLFNAFQGKMRAPYSRNSVNAIWSKIDHDTSGTIDKTELAKAFALFHVDLTPDEQKELGDSFSTLNLEEFQIILDRVAKSSKSSPKETKVATMIEDVDHMHAWW